jgi:hypothetical protein
MLILLLSTKHYSGPPEWLANPRAIVLAVLGGCYGRIFPERAGTDNQPSSPRSTLTLVSPNDQPYDHRA